MSFLTTFTPMITSAKKEVQLLLSLMKQAGITHVVLSPGSRNAPLTIAFDEDPFFTVYVVTDERCAAFYALGMAQQLRKPVAVACTSGSAPLNYFPAVVEAYYQQVPLLVLTADRPAEWIDHGDGQTIRQQNVYGTHVHDWFQLGPFYNDDAVWSAQLRVSELFQKSEELRGPVHINLPFNEPLYVQEEAVSKEYRFVKRISGVKSLSEAQQNELKQVWQASKKRLIIVGQDAPSAERKALLQTFAADSSVTVLVEHTSNCSSPEFIEPIDSALAVMQRPEDYFPDLVIQIGGAIVSKRIKKFLRDAESTIVTFDASNPFGDTFQGLGYTYDVSSVYGLKLLADVVLAHSNESTFGSDWRKLNDEVKSRHDKIASTLPYSDFKVVEAIIGALPKQSMVHFSNSSMIRYGLLFENSSESTYFCNRGTSGIDGCTSTACGSALVTPDQLHVLLTGDLSFFYDSNALWSAHVPANLRVIVVNNGGGDIFNIIPGPSSTNQLKKVFVAEHSFKAEYICKGFEIDYRSVASQGELASALTEFWNPAENGRAKVLEIHTQELNNSAVLQGYFRDLKG